MPSKPPDSNRKSANRERSASAASEGSGAARRPRPGPRLEGAPARGPDRMPPLAPETLSEAQRAAAAELEAGPRGAVVGPFIPALRSPEFMTRLQRLGQYLRYENALGPRLTELAILLVAREWSQEFEWEMHLESARAAGISSDVIEAIARGHKPAELDGDEAIVYDFLRELGAARTVADPTYGRAVAAFGEAGVVDLLGVAGYYTVLAMLLNVARTPVPPDSAR